LVLPGFRDHPQNDGFYPLIQGRHREPHRVCWP
jgi:hypothetical protein